MLTSSQSFETPRCIVRPVRDEDLEDVLWVYHACEDFLALGPVATASMEMVHADLRLSVEEGCCFHVIIDRESKKIIGVVDFSTAGWEGDPAKAFLSLLMIAAPYRSRGLGAEIVSAVEAQMRANPSLTTIASGVQVNNPGAVRFWQRMGYQIVSAPRLMPDQTTACELLKTV